MGKSPDDTRLLREIGVLQEAVQQAARPKWNKETHKLIYQGQVIKAIKQRKQAINVVPILDAFEEENWPPRIDDPLPGGRKQGRLHATISSLNDGLSLIRFHADGTGEGFEWKPK